MESGEIADQPIWSFIKEMNSVSDERLDSVAITDGYRQYTYRQMFRTWERYAEAFSGFGLTGENRSRVGIVGVTISETIFALYGLNMTGASVSLIYHLDLYDEKQIYSMIEREKITDLIISELFAFPNVMKHLHRDKEMLGIRNIIVLPSPMGGEYAFPALEWARKLNRELYREIPDGVHMDDLLNRYEAYPISIPKEPSPIVLHTTGTVSGMHKPVPLSNKAINSFVLSIIKAKETFEDFKRDFPDHPVTCVPFYLSWAYFMVDSLHTALSLGAEVICLPMASMNPHYSRVIEERVNMIFTGVIFDTWNKTRPDIDLSKLKFVIMGGTYISPEYKREFNRYLRSCGSTAHFINGYGLSELCGACAICPSSRDDDAIGYLLPGINAKILAEDEHRYYDISDGPRIGVLLLNSDTMSDGKLDGVEFFELEEVDGKKYFNTHDLVSVEEDGCLKCIGRSNQYFVNNAGVRFNAGLVERAVSSQPGIKACGLVPEFHKVLHDNVPILYAELSKGDGSELDTLRDALVQVFIEDELISDSNLPSQCVIVEHMPLNSNGKVDGKRLRTGSVKGDRYSINPAFIDDKLIDIVLTPAPEGEAATVDAGVPQELEEDPYNLLSSLFSAIPEIQEKGISTVLNIPGLRELIIKLTDFDIKNIPQSLWNISPKLFEITYKNNMLPLIREIDQIGSVLPLLGGRMPPMPPIPFPVFGGLTDSFSDSSMEHWDRIFEIRKSSLDATRDYWMRFFEDFMDAEDSFADSLPDGVTMSPFGPWAISPKQLMKQAREFQEMTLEHFVKIADSIVDFYIQSQEMYREAAKRAAGNSAKMGVERSKGAKADVREKPKKTRAKTGAAPKRKTPGARA